jgi:hypothetical protein
MLHGSVGFHVWATTVELATRRGHSAETSALERSDALGIVGAITAPPDLPVC